MLNFPETGLSTDRLLLKRCSVDYAPNLLSYAIDNKAHFQVWEPLRSDDFYTLEATTNRILSMEQAYCDSNGLHLLLFYNNRLIGVCNFTNMIRGVFQACYLGFSVDARYEGQGFMYEGLSCALDFVFNTLDLHRVMANYKPENHRSANLLARLGFEKEGFARSYLKINGEWTDHILTSRINVVARRLE